jgi:hypothetical protein
MRGGGGLVCACVHVCCACACACVRVRAHALAKRVKPVRSIPDAVPTCGSGSHTFGYQPAQWSSMRAATLSAILRMLLQASPSPPGFANGPNSTLRLLAFTHVCEARGKVRTSAPLSSSGAWLWCAITLKTCTDCRYLATAQVAVRRMQRRVPHLHQDWAHPQSHLHRDWAHPRHLCTGTGCTPAKPMPPCARARDNQRGCGGRWASERAAVRNAPRCCSASPHPCRAVLDKRRQTPMPAERTSSRARRPSLP